MKFYLINHDDSKLLFKVDKASLPRWIIKVNLCVWTDENESKNQFGKDPEQVSVCHKNKDQ